MNICVYCSSKNVLDEAYYGAGKAVGALIAARGHALVYGGYLHGVMGATAAAAAAGGADVIAVIPDMIVREGEIVPAGGTVIRTPDIRERKEKMETISDAFAVLPGGIGTMDELFELTVLKSFRKIGGPIGILNIRGCYDPLKELLDRMTAEGLLEKEHREMLVFCDTPEALLNALETGAGAR